MMKPKQYGGTSLVRFSAQALVIGAVLSATIFLLLIDSFKNYRSEISIFVGAKSQTKTIVQEDLVDNILEFPKTLSFYEKLLKNNADVRDVAEGQSPDKRKATWNRMLSVEKAGENASVIQVSIVAKNRNDAEKLNQKTVRTLFDVVSSYYDIKNDVDLRIIDGPIVKSQVVAWQLLLIFSVAAGFLIAGLLQFAIFDRKSTMDGGSEFLKKKSFFDFKKPLMEQDVPEIEAFDDFYDIEKSNAPFVVREEENYFSEKSDEDSKIREMKKLTKEMEPSKYPNFPEMPTNAALKAGAPNNLPIAGENFFAENAVEEDTVITEPELEEVKTENTAKEPTPEELKERLNKLLRGEF